MFVKMVNEIKIIKERKEWVVEDLNINPLSIAKWFYKHNIKDIAIIQRLTYLTYLKVLEKKNALLFTEDWFAWSGGPIVESAFHTMMKYEQKEYNKLFSTIPNLKEEKVLPYLEYVEDDYKTSKEEKNEYKFFDSIDNNPPYEIARLKVKKDELDSPKISLIDILEYNEWITKF